MNRDISYQGHLAVFVTVAVLVKVVFTALVEVEVARLVMVTEGLLVTVEVLRIVLVEAGRVAVLLIVVILVMVVVEAGTLRVLLTVVDLTLTVVYVEPGRVTVKVFPTSELMMSVTVDALRVVVFPTEVVSVIVTIEVTAGVVVTELFVARDVIVFMTVEALMEVSNSIHAHSLYYSEGTVEHQSGLPFPSATRHNRPGAATTSNSPLSPASSNDTVHHFLVPKPTNNLCLRPPATCHIHTATDSSSARTFSSRQPHTHN